MQKKKAKKAAQFCCLSVGQPLPACECERFGRGVRALPLFVVAMNASKYVLICK